MSDATHKLKNWKLYLVLVIIATIVVSGILLYVSKVQTKLVYTMAIKNAEIFSYALGEFRSVYTSEVVQAAKERGVIVTHDYKDIEHAIPLPTTLTILLAERIGQFSEGAKAYLYSAYPFPWRKKEYIFKDDFAKKAWQGLTKNSQQPYYAFEKENGKMFLKYATADIMRSACIQCHNTHPNSPKKDWKIGDVRGVLEVKMPVDSGFDVMSDNLRGTLFILIILSFVLISGGVAVTRMRKGDLELKKLVADKTKDLTREIDQRKQIQFQQKNTSEQLKRKNVIKSSVNEMSAVVQRATSLEDLATLALAKIAPLVEAGCGVIYINMESSQDNEILVLYGKYAIQNNQKLLLRVKIGEGLIGECAKEKKLIKLTNVPEDYIKISSGLGNGVPVNIIFLPLLFDNKLIGVLELASLHVFSDFHLEFLQEITASLAISIKNMLSYDKTEKLLNDSELLSQKLRQQQDELKKTGKYKAEFLATISHELRTPLNSMIVLSKVLSDNRNKTFTTKEIESLNIIHSSGQDLLYLINDILDFSKVVAGKLDILKEFVSIEKLANDLKQTFEAVYCNNKVSFKMEVDKNVPETIFTDLHRLKQILKNFLSNSFKFTNKGYVLLKISKSEDNVCFIRKNLNVKNSIVFSVIDSGIGISEQDIKFIFKEFHQGDGTISRNYGGTGLGLAISRELANILEGEIQVTSKIGEGSTFTLFLPLYGEGDAGIITKQADDVAKESERFSFNAKQNRYKEHSEILVGKKVLVIDDDVRSLFALSGVLEDAGLDVETVDNCELAIKKVKDANITLDIVLTDIMMPAMDGYEVVRTIRKIKSKEELPIIVLSASIIEDIKDECINLGASDYMTKPVDVDRLLSSMIEILS